MANREGIIDLAEYITFSVLLSFLISRAFFSGSESLEAGRNLSDIFQHRTKRRIVSRNAGGRPYLDACLRQHVLIINRVVHFFASAQCNLFVCSAAFAVAAGGRGAPSEGVYSALVCAHPPRALMLSAINMAIWE